MADVRSMLRAERQTRRITHPHASYSSDGKLLCNICEIKIKTEAQWQGHLHSTQHNLRINRAQEAALAREEGNGRKKRKASGLDTPSPDERKRPKAMADIEGPDIQDEEAVSLEPPPILAQHEDQTLSSSTAIQDAEGMTDPAELDAFEKELARLEATMLAETAIHSAATISAAPMTAEQVAAQAREEQSAQRGRRDAEIEAERDDATRLLEEEFEEMESLEERVKKLRQRREALKREERNNVLSGKELPVRGSDTNTVADLVSSGQQSQDEEDEDEDEIDDWNFGDG